MFLKVVILRKDGVIMALLFIILILAVLAWCYYYSEVRQIRSNRANTLKRIKLDTFLQEDGGIAVDNMSPDRNPDEDVFDLTTCQECHKPYLHNLNGGMEPGTCPKCVKKKGEAVTT